MQALCGLSCPDIGGLSEVASFSRLGLQISSARRWLRTALQSARSCWTWFTRKQSARKSRSRREDYTLRGSRPSYCCQLRTAKGVYGGPSSRASAVKCTAGARPRTRHSSSLRGGDSTLAMHLHLTPAAAMLHASYRSLPAPICRIVDLTNCRAQHGGARLASRVPAPGALGARESRGRATRR